MLRAVLLGLLIAFAAALRMYMLLGTLAWPIFETGVDRLFFLAWAALAAALFIVASAIFRLRALRPVLR